MKSKTLLVVSLLAIIPLGYLVHRSIAITDTEVHTNKQLPPSPGPVVQMEPMTKTAPVEAIPAKKISASKRIVKKVKEARREEATEPLAGVRQQKREQAQNKNPYAAQDLGVMEPQVAGQIYDPMAKRWVPGLSGPNVKINMGKAARKDATCQDESCVVRGEDGVSVAGVVVKTKQQRVTDPMMEGALERGNGVVTPVVYVK